MIAIQKMVEILEYRINNSVGATYRKTAYKELLGIARRLALIETSWDKDGFHIYLQWPMRGSGEGFIPTESWTEKTYSAAEAKAREYLEGLPGKGEK